MAEESSAPETHVTFNVKSSNDAKYVLTVPESMSVLDLKQKLSSDEYAAIPAERQRLIYSGRVLKDADTVGSYKIKDGNTVHLVRGAESNQRQNPANQSSATGTHAPSAVPQMATGTGNDPLAGLTGARYAGFAQMPGAGMFGPDGGMGVPNMDSDSMLRQLENPMFQSQMNEAMNNPMFLEQMERMFPNQPFLRQMMSNPEFRRMMTDPQMIRQSLQMRQAMQGGAGGAGSGFPAPGVTDNTPQQPGTATGGGNSATPGQTNTTGQAAPPNPFANPFGMMGGMGGMGGQGNPFAALFGAPPQAPTNPTSPTTNTNTSTASTTQSSTNTTSTSNPNSPPPPFSPFAQPGQQQGQQNPFAAMTQQLMQNPQAMQAAMEQMRQMGFGDMGMGAGMGGPPATGAGVGAGANTGAGAANPWANLFGPGMMGGMPPAAAPPDTRPPEEMYAEQLRQLNDMGFYEFERNVRALRQSGGSVQGAVEALLSGL